MITFLLLIIWAHFVGDFVLQSDTVATNKSSNNWVLSDHVLTYQVALLPLVFLFDQIIIGLLWVWINTALHWLVDYVTSRLAKKLYQAGDRHNFFVVIGFDQAVHLTILVSTFIMLM